MASVMIIIGVVRCDVGNDWVYVQVIGSIQYLKPGRRIFGPIDTLTISSISMLCHVRQMRERSLPSDGAPVCSSDVKEIEKCPDIYTGSKDEMMNDLVRRVQYVRDPFLMGNPALIA
ncbi:hypothetical protein CBL_05575 [Carabus blaptoides fortunei]